MWQIFNFLFGWDYIQWSNIADQGIARVFNDGAGRTVYWRYRLTNVIDVIENEEQVIWLTCKPSKYMQSNSGDPT